MKEYPEQQRAAHAARWQRGMKWDGNEILGVGVINEWHVVLDLSWGFVELDPQDKIVRVRKKPEYYAHIDDLRESLAADLLDPAIYTDAQIDEVIAGAGLDPASVARGAARVRELPTAQPQGELFALIPTKDPDHDE